MEETDSAHLITTDSPELAECAAKALDSGQRQELASGALSRQQSVSKLAEQHEVSRKFVYTQSAKAKQALDEAFCPTAPDNKVLFYLPVTKAWLRQLALALLLIFHSSLRGVVELLRDLFQVNISVGGVHNIVAEAIDNARQHNEQQDLSAVRIGAHDEIFQHSQPVSTSIRPTVIYSPSTSNATAKPGAFTCSICRKAALRPMRSSPTPARGSAKAKNWLCPTSPVAAMSFTASRWLPNWSSIWRIAPTTLFRLATSLNVNRPNTSVGRGAVISS